MVTYRQRIEGGGMQIEDNGNRWIEGGGMQIEDNALTDSQQDRGGRDADRGQW